MLSVWKIVDCFGEQKFSSLGSYAVLVLNRPISLPEPFVINLWNEACYRATTDGGTDRWYQFVSKISDKSKLKNLHPDLVSGDFDSILPETLNRCKELDICVIGTPDQDKTDFIKAVEEILKQSKVKIDSIMVVADSSGRLDHVMANLNTLYCFHKAPLYLLGPDNITWLLRAGFHRISIPETLVTSQAPCGLIPLGAPCVVSTFGLKWNLHKEEMKFGSLISTSNTYEDTSVSVETDSPLLWTMSHGIKKP